MTAVCGRVGCEMRLRQASAMNRIRLGERMEPTDTGTGCKGDCRNDRQAGLWVGTKGFRAWKCVLKYQVVSKETEVGGDEKLLNGEG